MATGSEAGATADPRAVLTRPAPPPDVTVRYGPLPEQVADLRFPATPAAGPPRLVVVVHGGFWRAAYDRRHADPLAADLTARGYLVAQLEYRRTGAPGGGWPGTFDDVAAGIAALPALIAGSAAQGGGSAAQVGSAVGMGAPVLVGHSAGGQLALWYAATHPDRVRGVLALAPVADLAEAYRLDLDAGAVAALLGGPPGKVPERYAQADPARLPPPRCRTVILHGTRDRQVPIGLSRAYLAAVGSTGADVRMVETPTEHFALIDPEADIWPTVLAGLLSVFG